jgi:hypothetical protein
MARYLAADEIIRNAVKKIAHQIKEISRDMSTLECHKLSLMLIEEKPWLGKIIGLESNTPKRQSELISLFCTRKYQELGLGDIYKIQRKYSKGIFVFEENNQWIVFKDNESLAFGYFEEADYYSQLLLDIEYPPVI